MPSDGLANEPGDRGHVAFACEAKAPPVPGQLGYALIRGGSIGDYLYVFHRDQIEFAEEEFPGLPWFSEKQIQELERLGKGTPAFEAALQLKKFFKSPLVTPEPAQCLFHAEPEGSA